MMEYDKRVLLICAVCAILGVIFILVGIITSEIEISKNQVREMYDNCNYQKRK